MPVNTPLHACLGIILFCHHNLFIILTEQFALILQHPIGIVIIWDSNIILYPLRYTSASYGGSMMGLFVHIVRLLTKILHDKLSHFQYRALHLTRFWGHVILCNSNVMIMIKFQTYLKQNSGLQLLCEIYLKILEMMGLLWHRIDIRI